MFYQDYDDYMAYAFYLENLIENLDPEVFRESIKYRMDECGYSLQEAMESELGVDLSDINFETLCNYFDLYGLEPEEEEE